MIIGAHTIIYSADPEADRAFLREVLGFPHVDAGDGWLIFGLPPAEVAVHPSDENDVHEVFLMTDDVEALVASMAERGIETSPVANQGWGLLTQVTMPGGGKLGIYQPRHPSPPPHVVRRARAAEEKRPSRAKAKRPSTRKKPPTGKKPPRAARGKRRRTRSP